MRWLLKCWGHHTPDQRQSGPLDKKHTPSSNAQPSEVQGSAAQNATTITPGSQHHLQHPAAAASEPLPVAAVEPLRVSHSDPAHLSFTTAAAAATAAASEGSSSTISASIPSLRQQPASAAPSARISPAPSGALSHAGTGAGEQLGHATSGLSAHGLAHSNVSGTSLALRSSLYQSSSNLTDHDAAGDPTGGIVAKEGALPGAARAGATAVSSSQPAAATGLVAATTKGSGTTKEDKHSAAPGQTGPHAVAGPASQARSPSPLSRPPPNAPPAAAAAATLAPPSNAAPAAARDSMDSDGSDGHTFVPLAQVFQGRASLDALLLFSALVNAQENLVSGLQMHRSNTRFPLERIESGDPPADDSDAPVAPPAATGKSPLRQAAAVQRPKQQQPDAPSARAPTTTSAAPSAGFKSGSSGSTPMVSASEVPLESSCWRATPRVVAGAPASQPLHNVGIDAIGSDTTSSSTRWRPEPTSMSPLGMLPSGDLSQRSGPAHAGGRGSGSGRGSSDTSAGGLPGCGQPMRQTTGFGRHGTRGPGPPHGSTRRSVSVDVNDSRRSSSEGVNTGSNMQLLVLDSQLLDMFARVLSSDISTSANALAAQAALAQNSGFARPSNTRSSAERSSNTRSSNTRASTDRVSGGSYALLAGLQARARAEAAAAGAAAAAMTSSPADAVVAALAARSRRSSADPQLGGVALRQLSRMATGTMRAAAAAAVAAGQGPSFDDLLSLPTLLLDTQFSGALAALMRQGTHMSESSDGPLLRLATGSGGVRDALTRLNPQASNDFSRWSSHTGLGSLLDAPLTNVLRRDDAVMTFTRLMRGLPLSRRSTAASSMRRQTSTLRQQPSLSSQATTLQHQETSTSFPLMGQDTSSLAMSAGPELGFSLLGAELVMALRAATEAAAPATARGGGAAAQPAAAATSVQQQQQVAWAAAAAALMGSPLRPSVAAAAGAGGCKRRSSSDATDSHSSLGTSASIAASPQQQPRRALAVRGHGPLTRGRSRSFHSSQPEDAPWSASTIASASAGAYPPGQPVASKGGKRGAGSLDLSAAHRAYVSPAATPAKPARQSPGSSPTSSPGQGQGGNARVSSSGRVARVDSHSPIARRALLSGASPTHMRSLHMQAVTSPRAGARAASRRFSGGTGGGAGAAGAVPAGGSPERCAGSSSGPGPGVVLYALQPSYRSSDLSAVAVTENAAVDALFISAGSSANAGSAAAAALGAAAAGGSVAAGAASSGTVAGSSDQALVAESADGVGPRTLELPARPTQLQLRPPSGPDQSIGNPQRTVAAVAAAGALLAALPGQPQAAAGQPPPLHDQQQPHKHSLQRLAPLANPNGGQPVAVRALGLALAGQPSGSTLDSPSPGSASLGHMFRIAPGSSRSLQGPGAPTIAVGGSTAPSFRTAESGQGSIGQPLQAHAHGGSVGGQQHQHRAPLVPAAPTRRSNTPPLASWVQGPSASVDFSNLSVDPYDYGSELGSFSVAGGSFMLSEHSSVAAPRASGRGAGPR